MQPAMRNHHRLLRLGKMLVFGVAVLATTRLSLEFAAVTSASTAAFGFLVVVLLSAYFGDRFVALSTLLVAGLCFDFFFLPPFGTLHIAALPDWISLAAFLLAAVMIARLTAAAAEHAARWRELARTIAQLQELGEWLQATPDDQLTLSGIAGAVRRIFALDYCSIRVYGSGRWKCAAGTAVSDGVREAVAQPGTLPEHATSLAELADENALGVRYVPILQGAAPLGMLAIRSETLPAEAPGAIAALLGVQLRQTLQDNRRGGAGEGGEVASAPPAVGQLAAAGQLE